MAKISTALVGLGKIGQLLDEGKNPESHCLTHAAAFSIHKDFDLKFGVDPDPVLRKKFSGRFHVDAIPDLTSSPSVDLWVIAAPTDKNLSVFKEVITRKPKMVLMEKPFGESLEQAEEINLLAARSGVKLAVNFMRRAEPGVLKVREMITSGQLGKIEKVVVTYSKGLLNSGSHFIDLMRFWLGESSHHQVLGSVDQRYESDIEPDFSIRFGQTPVYFLSCKEENYSVRDIEILGSQGAIRYLRGGQKILHANVVESPLFKGYRFLSMDEREIPNALDRVQYFVAEQISSAFKSNDSVLSDGRAAVKTMEDVERIRALCRVQ